MGTSRGRDCERVRYAPTGRLIAFVCAFCAPSFATAAVSAAELHLGVPIACRPEDDCSIQNYVDLKPGPGVRDFGCGVLTYDGHRGTDFQVRDLARTKAGVPVVAAAPGVVRSVRDGMPDTGKKGYDAGGETDRALGNAVAVDHGKGWTTFYGHLRDGSLKVRPGDRVAKGQVLGEVGLSGNTEFPHLHFEVRKQGAVVDPFTGAGPGSICGETSGSLWETAARAQLRYTPTGAVCTGWSASPPDRSAVLEDCERPPAVSPSSPAIVGWIEIFGLQKGDEIRVRLSGPDGSALAEAAGVVENDSARQFRYVGRKRPADGWTKGMYRARYTVTRSVKGERQAVIDLTRGIDMR